MCGGRAMWELYHKMEEGRVTKMRRAWREMRDEGVKEEVMKMTYTVLRGEEREKGDEEARKKMEKEMGNKEE